MLSHLRKVYSDGSQVHSDGSQVVEEGVVVVVVVVVEVGVRHDFAMLLSSWTCLPST